MSDVFDADSVEVRPIEHTGTHPVLAAWQQLVEHVQIKQSEKMMEKLQTLEDAFSLAIVAGTGSSNTRAADDMEQHRAGYSAYRDEIEKVVAGNEEVKSSAASIHYQSKINTESRRIFYTETGEVGLGNYLMQVGDACVVFRGANVPFILRPLEQQGRFKLVGESYIGGVMEGQVIEAVDQGIFHETDIILV
jgi:hypothetical protein